MVQKLEDLKGGGGSIKVGTVGTISSLMTRELQSAGSTSKPCLSSTHGSKRRQNSAICGTSSSTVRQKASSEEAGSRSSRSSGIYIENGSSETANWTSAQNHDRIHVRSTTPTPTPTPNKQKQQKASSDEEGSRVVSSESMSRRNLELPRKYKRTHHIPILGVEDIALDKTPDRKNRVKRGSGMVAIVDVHCGSPSGSLANRIKKLGFSKLSQSFI